jgi:hypothetical protein
MAEKRVSVRLAAVGGRQVRAEKGDQLRPIASKLAPWSFQQLSEKNRRSGKPMELQRPISEAVWGKLIQCSRSVTVRDWATSGVFATAVGPEYVAGSVDSLLYVGRAGGPLIDSVGLSYDYLSCARAATNWMIERRNPSAFWQFADLIVSDRKQIAWSNLAKIDTRTAGPPNANQWNTIRRECMEALSDEINFLRPARTVFVTSDFGLAEITSFLKSLQYRQVVPETPLESGPINPLERWRAA